MTNSENDTPPPSDAGSTLPPQAHRHRAPISAFALFQDITNADTPPDIDPQLSNFGFPAGSSNAPGLGISASSHMGVPSDDGPDEDLQDIEEDNIDFSSSSFGTPSPTASSLLMSRPLTQDMTKFGERLRPTLLPNPTPQALGLFTEFCLPHTADERMVVIYATMLHTQQLLQAKANPSTVNYRIPQDLKVSVEPYTSSLADSLYALHIDGHQYICLSVHIVSYDFVVSWFCC